MEEAIKLLKQQIEKAEELKKPPPYHPRYNIWKDTTLKIIKDNFNQTYFDLFNNPGPHFIATDDEEHYQYFLQAIDEQKELLRAIIDEAERFSSTNVGSESYKVQDYSINENIIRVSFKLLEDGHYAQAIEEAFKFVIKVVKEIVKEKTKETLEGDRLMNRAFGCENQAPVVKFNELKDQEDIDEQKGIMYLFKGIVGIRNKKAHSNVILDDKSRAIEYIALSSLLLRLLEEFKDKD